MDDAIQYHGGYLPCHKITIAPIILFGIIPVANVCNKNTGAHYAKCEYIHTHIHAYMHTYIHTYIHHIQTLKYLCYGFPCYQQH